MAGGTTLLESYNGISKEDIPCFAYRLSQLNVHLEDMSISVRSPRGVCISLCKPFNYLPVRLTPHQHVDFESRPLHEGQIAEHSELLCKQKIN